MNKVSSFARAVLVKPPLPWPAAHTCPCLSPCPMAFPIQPLRPASPSVHPPRTSQNYLPRVATELSRAGGKPKPRSHHPWGLLLRPGQRGVPPPQAPPGGVPPAKERSRVGQHAAGHLPRCAANHHSGSRPVSFPSASVTASPRIPPAPVSAALPKFPIPGQRRHDSADAPGPRQRDGPGATEPAAAAGPWPQSAAAEPPATGRHARAAGRAASFPRGQSALRLARSSLL